MPENEKKHHQNLRETNLTVEQATEEITNLLKLPEPLAKDRVLTWIRGALYLITPDQVKAAIKNNVRVDQLLFDYLHLNHFLVRPLATRIFRIFWNSASYYLTDALQLYNILASNLEIQKELDTEAGRKWLDQSCINGYIVLYYYVWLS